MTPARVIVADPPWQFRDKLPGNGRGAVKYYPTMSTDEIARFPLPPLLPDSYLLLWRVSSMQQDALLVAWAWGFTVKSEIVWIKLTKTGKPHFGMGLHTRASHETALLAVRGKPVPRSRSVRDTFEAPVGPHSTKPDEFYALVEELSDGPYVELFGGGCAMTDRIAQSINTLAQDVHDLAVRNGWHEHGCYREDGSVDVNRVLALLMLITTEIAEAAESVREGVWDQQDERGKPIGVASELADVVIRVLDTSRAIGIDIGSVVVEKHRYNKTRSYRHGGKLV